MQSKNPNQLAQEYFEKAYQHQLNGELDDAVKLYKLSISLHPTAESHTFLGWTYSMQGKIDEAIKECEAAIQIDPDFGNPWNDIGAYLLEKGKYEEAIPYLDRAKKAKRYEPRHYPHFNLSRVYVKQGRYDEAVSELREALKLYPQYTAARQQLGHILGMLN